MKKLNYFAVAALAAAASLSANAQNSFANPTEKYTIDGEEREFAIVKYDMEKGAFAESNDWEIDETIVFAVDITGTSLEAAVKQPSRNPAVKGRGIAYDLFVTSAPEEVTGKKNIDGRLMHIKDNIYGMTVNFFQQAITRYSDAGLLPDENYENYGCQEPGYIVTYNSNIFCFGYSEESNGAEWWDNITTPIQDELAFRTNPYTGTKVTVDYCYGDTPGAETYQPWPGCNAAGCFAEFGAWGGYSAPEFYKDFIVYVSGGSVEGVAADLQTVSSKYFDLQGRQIEEPANGLFIRQDLKADGSVKAVKVVK